MNNSEFKKQFIKICSKRWIKGVNNTTNSAGLTFESLLGKASDSMYFPDYYGMEIKTTTRFSNFPISLFSMAFDGPNLFETNTILEKYGKVDYKYKDRKTLIGPLNNKYPTKLSKYSFMLNIDNKEKKLFLNVYDDYDNLIEKEAYISFENIINRLKLKLNNMVIVKASKQNIDGNLYFRYYEYKKYKLRKYVNFFELINDEIIKVTIMCRVSRSGIEEGRQRNKSLVFQIDKDKIDYLFECVEAYSNDKNII